MVVIVNETHGGATVRDSSGNIIPAGSQSSGGVVTPVSGGGSVGAPPPPSISQPPQQPGESASEYAYRTHPEEYGGSVGNAEQQRLIAQAQTMQERGGYYDASQEARNIAVYGEQAVAQRKAMIREQGGGNNPELYTARDNATGYERQVQQDEAAQIMAARIREAQGRAPIIRTAENQQMSQSRGFPEAPGLAYAERQTTNAPAPNTTPLPIASSLPLRNPSAINANAATNPNLVPNSMSNNDIETYKKMYERANPAQKAALQAATLFSTQGYRYLGALAPGGKSPTDIVFERMKQAEEDLRTKNARDIITSQMFGNPLTVAASFYPVAAGLSAGARAVGLGTAAATRSIPIGLQVTKGLNVGLMGAGLLGAGYDVMTEPTTEGKIGKAAVYGAGFSSITGRATESLKGAKSAPDLAYASKTENVNPSSSQGRSSRISPEDLSMNARINAAKDVTPPNERISGSRPGLSEPTVTLRKNPISGNYETLGDTTSGILKASMNAAKQTAYDTIRTGRTAYNAARDYVAAGRAERISPKPQPAAEPAATMSILQTPTITDMVAPQEPYIRQNRPTAGRISNPQPAPNVARVRGLGQRVVETTQVQELRRPTRQNPIEDMRDIVKQSTDAMRNERLNPRERALENTRAKVAAYRQAIQARRPTGLATRESMFPEPYRRPVIPRRPRGMAPRGDGGLYPYRRPMRQRPDTGIQPADKNPLDILRESTLTPYEARPPIRRRPPVEEPTKGTKIRGGGFGLPGGLGLGDLSMGGGGGYSRGSRNVSTERNLPTMREFLGEVLGNGRRR